MASRDQSLSLPFSPAICGQDIPSSFGPLEEAVTQYFEKNKTKTGNNYVPYALAIAIGSILAMSGILDGLIGI